MARPRPLSDDEKARILELHAEGLSRGEIARRLGRAASSVSVVVHEAGLSFERPPELVAATEARNKDNAEKRSRLQALLLDDALRIREQLWEPATVYNWSKDNAFDTQVLDQPDFAGQNAIMRTVGVAVDKAAKLAEQDRQAQDPTEVVSLLGALVDDLRDEYAEESDDEQSDPPEAE